MRSYFDYARAARGYEQESEWIHAMRLWGMAAQAAGRTTKNGKWALYRVQFCQHVHMREQIAVDATINKRLREHNLDVKKRDAEEAKRKTLRDKIHEQMKWRKK